MRSIAFYLPQFHPVPENNRWWGEGFTEWRNVAKARPRFAGHHQPQIPERLGFYDLRLAETREAQAALAKAHGVHGFCYYHFWFNGKMLLEKPLNDVLSSGQPDFPFCVCWANENWTRRWDGGENQILMGQDYANYDADAHMDWLLEAFADPRYITVSGKPLFLVYNASAIPDLARRIQQWRERAAGAGLPGLYICATLSVRNSMSAPQLTDAGFDAVIDFLPRPDLRGNRKPGNFLRYLLPRVYNKLLRKLGWDARLPLAPVLNRFSYRRLKHNALQRWQQRDDLLPCVMPSWDNCARKRVDADVYQNDEPRRYQRWLRAAVALVQRRPREQQLVFLNAWNEWAEGCHLEPDTRHGLAFLQATRDALTETAQPEEPARADAGAKVAQTAGSA